MDRQKMNNAIADSRNTLEDIYRAGYIAGREENRIKMTNYEMLRNKDMAEFAYWLANIHASCDYNPFCPACESKEWARCECKGGVDGDACADLWMNWLYKERRQEEEDGVNNVSEETE